MINPSFEELKEINESRYLIVAAVAQRARRIIEGSDPLIETSTKIPVTLAIEEIMAKKVDIKDPSED